MSRLDELIKELCPDGVKYCKFADMCEYIRGVTYNKSQEAQNGDTECWKILRANNITLSQNVLNFDDVKQIKKEVKIKPAQFLKKDDILICAGSGSKEHVGKVAFIFEDMKYSFGGFMAVIRCTKELNSRFLFHLLTGSEFKNYLSFALNSTTINNLNSSVMADFYIPIPPLPIQQEIIRILDSFTDLTAELTAELEARKKQYEYYQKKLLSFGPQVHWTTLGEIGKVSMCKRIMKNETSVSGDVPFYKIGTFGKQADAYISKQTFEHYKSEFSYPKKGDILISAAGTIGRTVVFDGSPAYFQDSNIVWLANDERYVLNSFLYYWYQTKPWKISTGGTIARLYNDNIAGAKVPIVPIDEQKKIVNALDRFNAVCNDISCGLPAEIAARQKQYEYYRDKLLTFRSVEVPQ